MLSVSYAQSTDRGYILSDSVMGGGPDTAL